MTKKIGESKLRAVSCLVTIVFPFVIALAVYEKTFLSQVLAMNFI
jgi:hypothetical protein